MAPKKAAGFTVADLDRIPMMCGVNDLSLVFGCNVNSIAEWNKRGLLKRFEVKGAVGLKRWSGVLVRKYLEASVLDAPEVKFFGSARRRSV